MALLKQKMLKGTVLKMTVNFKYEGGDDFSLEDIDFFTEWYCSSKRVKIEKKDHVFEDGVWYAYVDTGKTGTGTLKMRLWAEIPDSDAEFGTRTEYAEYTTDVVIY